MFCINNNNFNWMLKLNNKPFVTLITNSYNFEMPEHSHLMYCFLRFHQNAATTHKLTETF